MNWLNIYGDNKSLSVALDSVRIGETVKADVDDSKRIRVSIANSFSLTGRGKFSTKTGMDEEGQRVLFITRESIGDIKTKRYPRVKTFIDGDIVGVLRITAGVAYLAVLPMGDYALDSFTPTNKITDDCEKFCNTYNLKLKY